jgi:hypothetical protein
VYIEFKPTYAHQGHYVYFNGKFTGITVNLYAYQSIKEYKAKVDKQIEEFKIKNNE